MSLRNSYAILRHELRVMWTDPSTVIFVVVMPLIMVALMKELFATALRAEGFGDANGSEFAVPAMAVGFAAFGVGYSGFTFFRDHGWGTWDRLRATPASSVDIMIGKVLPSVGVTFVQLALLFVLGGPLFGLRVTGSWSALFLLVAVVALTLSAFGMLVTAITRTMNQLNAVGSVGGMAMAMLGGAWVPVATMPGWAQAIAPALPTYWAMEGFRDVILEGKGMSHVVVPVLVMVGFGLLYAVVAAARFRFEDTKVYFG
ncbi:MAG: ABC transporter permease [Actinomycetes bacterium]